MPSNMTQSVGRRKEAVARVRLMDGKSPITVNGKPISEVFPGPINQKKYSKPFEATKTVGMFTGTIKIEGGGTASRLDAVILGMARSLAKLNDAYHSALRKEGLLTRDARVRERRKVGQGGRARAKKQSPKR